MANFENFERLATDTPMLLEISGGTG